MGEDLKRLAEGLKTGQVDPRPFCGKFFELLTSWLTRREGSLQGQLSVLRQAIEIFTVVRLVLPNSDEVENFTQMLFMRCARLVLSNEFQSATCTEVNHFKTVVKKAIRQLKEKGYGHRFLMVEWLIENHWKNSVLRAMILGKPIDYTTAVEYIGRAEYPELLELRIEMLLDDGCEDLALNLCNWCVQHETFKYHSFIRAVQLMLLHSKGLVDIFYQECITLSSCVGLGILKCIEQEARGSKAYLAIAQTFLIQDWLRPNKYCCTKELLGLWLEAEYCHSNSEGEFLFAVMRVAEYAHNTWQLMALIDVMHEEFGDQFLQFYFEVCLLSLKINIAGVGTITGPRKGQALKDARSSITHICTVLSCVCCSRSPKMRQCSMLTALTLEPSIDVYHAVEKLFVESPAADESSGNSFSPTGGAVIPYFEVKGVQKETVKEVVNILNMLKKKELDPTLPKKQLMCKCIEYLQACGVNISVSQSFAAHSKAQNQTSEQAKNDIVPSGPAKAQNEKTSVPVGVKHNHRTSNLTKKEKHSKSASSNDHVDHNVSAPVKNPQDESRTLDLSVVKEQKSVEIQGASTAEVAMDLSQPASASKEVPCSCDSTYANVGYSSQTSGPIRKEIPCQCQKESVSREQAALQQNTSEHQAGDSTSEHVLKASDLLQPQSVPAMQQTVDNAASIETASVVDGSQEAGDELSSVASVEEMQTDGENLPHTDNAVVVSETAADLTVSGNKGDLANDDQETQNVTHKTGEKLPILEQLYEETRLDFASGSYNSMDTDTVTPTTTSDINVTKESLVGERTEEPGVVGVERQNTGSECISQKPEETDEGVSNEVMNVQSEGDSITPITPALTDLVADDTVMLPQDNLDSGDLSSINPTIGSEELLQLSGLSFDQEERNGASSPFAINTEGSFENAPFGDNLNLLPSENESTSGIDVFQTDYCDVADKSVVTEQEELLSKEELNTVLSETEAVPQLDISSTEMVENNTAQTGQITNDAEQATMLPVGSVDASASDDLLDNTVHESSVNSDSQSKSQSSSSMSQIQCTINQPNIESDLPSNNANVQDYGALITELSKQDSMFLGNGAALNHDVATNMNDTESASGVSEEFYRDDSRLNDEGNASNTNYIQDELVKSKPEGSSDSEIQETNSAMTASTIESDKIQTHSNNTDTSESCDTFALQTSDSPKPSQAQTEPHSPFPDGENHITESRDFCMQTSPVLEAEDFSDIADQKELAALDDLSQTKPESFEIDQTNVCTSEMQTETENLDAANVSSTIDEVCAASVLGSSESELLSQQAEVDGYDKSGEIHGDVCRVDKTVPSESTVCEAEDLGAQKQNSGANLGLTDSAIEHRESPQGKLLSEVSCENSQPSDTTQADKTLKDMVDKNTSDVFLTLNKEVSSGQIDSSSSQNVGRVMHRSKSDGEQVDSDSDSNKNIESKQHKTDASELMSEAGKSKSLPEGSPKKKKVPTATLR